MAKALIKSYMKGLTGVVIAEVETVDGRVVINTSSSILRGDLLKGIVGRMSRTFTVDDGDDFVRELPYVYSGSVVRAEVV